VAIYLGAIVAANVLLGLIPAFIARSKGRSFIGWWALGLFFLVPALVAALVIGPTRDADVGRVQCPRCAEWIVPGAQVCRFCGTEFGVQGYLTPSAVPTQRRAHPTATRNLLIAATALSVAPLASGFVLGGGPIGWLAFMSLPPLLITAGIVSLIGRGERPTWLKATSVSAFADALAIPAAVFVGFGSAIEIALLVGIWVMTVIAILNCKSTPANFGLTLHPTASPAAPSNQTLWHTPPATAQPFAAPPVGLPPAASQHAPSGTPTTQLATTGPRTCRNPICAAMGAPSTSIFCTSCGSAIP
jgi:hypothetical protein